MKGISDDKYETIDDDGDCSNDISIEDIVYNDTASVNYILGIVKECKASASVQGNRMSAYFYQN